MASTNKTTNLELSQYVSSDKPTYLVDYNSDMAKIDTGVHTAQVTADTASTAATNAQATAETAQTTANTAVTNAATAQTGVNENSAKIGTLANLTTTEKTNLVGATNEVNNKANNNLASILALEEKVVHDSGTGYIQFEDGTMIQYGDVTLAGGPLSDFYSFCKSTSDYTINLEKAFVNSGYTVTLNSNTYQVFSLHLGTRNVSSFQAAFFLPNYYTDFTGADIDCEYIAIGKWK